MIMLVMFASLAFGQLTNELVRACEDEIIKVTQNQYEMCIVLSDEGDILLKKIGTRSRVSFTDAELESIYGAAVVIHNHPSSGGLSVADMTFAIEHNIREIRALAIDGIYGYGSWVMINEQCEDKYVAMFEAAAFRSKVVYTLVHDYVDYIEKTTDRFIRPDLTLYVLRQLEWMQVAQLSDYYKTGKMRFVFELSNFKSIPFDMLAYKLGGELPDKSNL